ncbi:3720_t:CDS:2 [Entrophospora sp. SA101]|nr:6038_t:CDS:2 [Entrophospora sp. SA101]CAJ0826730.1 1322_t:CDS:2 [Entrophospora sp. SA101]CAJ0826743.1 1327_t:CDS:2 [Entrophospora sp. SA101]CAJ0830174.1 3720_t:CDS:2 [Entrophospora sp. SA101]
MEPRLLVPQLDCLVDAKVLLIEYVKITLALGYQPPPSKDSVNPNLQPPKDTLFTPAELAKYDGTDASQPIYVAIKGTIFDVTTKRESYGPGGSYNVFAGKDASKALGMGSLQPEDVIADYSSLDDKQLKVLEDWFEYFKKRYNIIGKL